MSKLRDHIRRTGLSLAIAGLSLANSARADDLLGFYLGAEAYWAHGYSDVPLGIPAADLQNGFIPNRLDESHRSATPVIGFRPVALLGAEIKYVDFGRKQSFLVSNEEGYNLQAGSKAIALFGMIYAPLPVRFIDFYGKAGVAEVISTFSGNAILMTPGLAPPYYLTWAANVNRTEVRFAYGAGAQVKLSSMAVRAEYERLQESAGNPPYIFSLGATWTF
jgi:opacity protein-like surface antigen